MLNKVFADMKGIREQVERAKQEIRSATPDRDQEKKTDQYIKRAIKEFKDESDRLRLEFLSVQQQLEGLRL